MGEAGIALENASVDRPVDEFHFECPKGLRQSRLNCLGGHFSLSYLIEIIQWASPALKGKSTVGFVIDTFARRIVGWRASRTAHTGFVVDALEQALHERRPVHGGGFRVTPPTGGITIRAIR